MEAAAQQLRTRVNAVTYKDERCVSEDISEHRYIVRKAVWTINALSFLNIIKTSLIFVMKLIKDVKCFHHKCHEARSASQNIFINRINSCVDNYCELKIN
jgi:hypothetical protein